jgi:thiol-disulfide isomerase/thioredoxin
MNMRLLIIIIALELIQLRASGQEQYPEVMDYNGFESLFLAESDTLFVINFWATWCKPCVAELPYFEKIDQDYRSQKVRVLLVSLDFVEDIETRLIPFIEKKGIKSRVILLDESNPNDFIDRVHSQWTGAIPATLIRKREEYQFYEKSFTYEELEIIVKQNLELK